MMYNSSKRGHNSKPCHYYPLHNIKTTHHVLRFLTLSVTSTTLGDILVNIGKTKTSHKAIHRE